MAVEQVKITLSFTQQAAERMGVEMVELREQLRDQLLKHVNRHGPSSAFMVTDVECDLLTEGELIMGDPRDRHGPDVTAHRNGLSAVHKRSDIVGRFRGVPIIIVDKEELTAASKTTAAVHQLYDKMTRGHVVKVVA